MRHAVIDSISVTGDSAPILGSEGTLQEWQYLSIEGGETGVSMSHHRSEIVGKCGPQQRPIAPFYHIAVPLTSSLGTVFRNGRHLATFNMETGGVRVRDHEECWAVEMLEPFQGVEFCLSKEGLDAFSYDEQHTSSGSFADLTKEATFDGVVLGLAQALLTSARQPDSADALFVSSVLLAVKVHTWKHYGGFLSAPRKGPAHLARWQEKRARELMGDALDSQLLVEQIAAACRLSPAHFARAFKKSTGLAPHQWRTRCRVDEAKAMLGDSAASLSDIASACGFVDQSHLNKVFSRFVGATPGAFRRDRTS